ncbi:hypothetical protein CERZMDRAFT_101545 [Cercospora zeae-maydis SCOH1-5]|uniref:Uncharacterized protein n=1 Tax=Cercospora zeae-maydis SCOH1-5 TaxID=717836 RepID=A0A6A6F1C7_9PEZI|nr:hypothetical protein CERZMDRAFT_101545 [Cercospora zeae-maydis SCOH1-5]
MSRRHNDRKHLQPRGAPDMLVSTRCSPRKTVRRIQTQGYTMIHSKLGELRCSQMQITQEDKTWLLRRYLHPIKAPTMHVPYLQSSAIIPRGNRPVLMPDISLIGSLQQRADGHQQDSHSGGAVQAQSHPDPPEPQVTGSD